MSTMTTSSNALPIGLVGDHELVPCVDGIARPYLNLDSAASTSALPAVARRVEEFLPSYSSVHRGAGFRSRHATAAYEQARDRRAGVRGADRRRRRHRHLLSQHHRSDQPSRLPAPARTDAMWS